MFFLAASWCRSTTSYETILPGSLPPATVANIIVIERTDEGMAGDNPLARDIRTAFGKAHEVVSAALYFVSAASSYTTGAIMNIDGGVLP